MPITACVSSNEIPTPWNIGDIRHISTGPDCSTCPRHKCNVNNGIPINNDNIKNCIMKHAEKKIKYNIESDVTFREIHKYK